MNLERRHGHAAIIGGIFMGILVGACCRWDVVMILVGIALGATSAPMWMALGELRQKRRAADRDAASDPSSPH